MAFDLSRIVTALETQDTLRQMRHVCAGQSTGSFRTLNEAGVCS
jgi:hypothetical protein